MWHEFKKRPAMTSQKNFCYYIICARWNTYVFMTADKSRHAGCAPGDLFSHLWASVLHSYIECMTYCHLSLIQFLLIWSSPQGRERQGPSCSLCHTHTCDISPDNSSLHLIICVFVPEWVACSCQRPHKDWCPKGKWGREEAEKEGACEYFIADALL